MIPDDFEFFVNLLLLCGHGLVVFRSHTLLDSSSSQS